MKIKFSFFPFNIIKVFVKRLFKLIVNYHEKLKETLSNVKIGLHFLYKTQKDNYD